MEGTSQISHHPRTIGIIGSHRFGWSPDIMDAAVSLGRELGQRGIRVVYDGGNIGLQGCVASVAKSYGSQVIGFIPRLIAERHLYGPTVGIERRVPNYNLGCYEMCHFVDAFVILPGGVETMEGLFSIMSWDCDGIHTKPIGLLNVKGYFYGLLKFLDDCVSQNFMEGAQRRLFIYSFIDAKLLDRLESAIAFPGAHANYEAQVNSGEVDLTLHL